MRMIALMSEHDGPNDDDSHDDLLYLFVESDMKNASRYV